MYVSPEGKRCVGSIIICLRMERDVSEPVIYFLSENEKRCVWAGQLLFAWGWKEMCLSRSIICLQMERDASEQVNYYLSEDGKRCVWAVELLIIYLRTGKVVSEQVNYHLSEDWKSWVWAVELFVWEWTETGSGDGKRSFRRGTELRQFGDGHGCVSTWRDS